MKIRILESAKKDLKDGFKFYETKETGLGFYFLETLYSDIDSLLLFAGIHSIHFQNYHRLLSKRFPFAVYYRIISKEIRISAVVDCRRNPAWIRKKLGG
ncbi:MAG: type II toxin-antitoxin system RelE/ParE family toxin [Kiritimatiellae bacterium]|jgi:hypothetical protein|nr:type II toxin-antitoxin system RelE/ParE family toxin [Kiritimatiellia bacterium]